MLDLRRARNVVIIGGGAPGWLAALTMRRVFNPRVTVWLIDAWPLAGLGLSESCHSNILPALQFNGVDLGAFMDATGATYKTKHRYTGWVGGEAGDHYHRYLLTPSHQLNREFNGYYPYLSALLHERLPVHRVLEAHGDTLGPNVVPALHFDSQKCAEYFRAIATERGVRFLSAKVLKGRRNAAGQIVRITTDVCDVDCDFVVDASGLSRVLIRKLDAGWESFAGHLPVDRILPFKLPQPVSGSDGQSTHVQAMRFGWVWQSPLRDFVGAGYAFGSSSASLDDVAQEILERFGVQVDPAGMLAVEPGCYRHTWVGNVVAVGMASGFVEPIEVSPFGHLIEQLRNLERVLAHAHGVISGRNITEFNQATRSSWSELRDFVRMHYDRRGRIGDFWRHAEAMPQPDSYAHLKACWQERTPRWMDLVSYASHGWREAFQPSDWVCVAQALGVIPRSAAMFELNGLPESITADLRKYFQAAKECS